MIDKIFLNLPVKDLKKSKAFFSQMGFRFDPQFTDENATCLIIGENIYAMLLLEKFFKTFLRDRHVADAAKQTEMLVAIHTSSRKDVDTLADKAIKAGGKVAREPEDHGWMYTRSFSDLDGHIWEIFTMDMSKMPPQQ